MPNIQPDGVVELYSHVDIDPHAGIQIKFENAEEQSAYFAAHRVASKVECSYMRKSRALRLEISTSVVNQCNYIAFRNPAFENKVFFAYIKSWEYVNNVTTDIYYQIDWYQTDCFSATCRDCKIEREHLSESQYQQAVANPWRTDIPELLTSEPLEVSTDFEAQYPDDVGQYGLANTDHAWRLRFPYATEATQQILTICISPFNPRNLDTDASAASQKWDTLKNSVDYWGNLTPPEVTDTTMFNQWSNGFARPFAFGGITITTGQEQTAVDRMKEVIDLLTFNDLSSCIIGLYVLPAWVFKAITGDQHVGGPLYLDMTMKPMTGVDPKLNTFPFRYIRVITADGSTKEYDITKFYSNKPTGHHCEFKMFGDASAIPTTALVPYRYKNASGGDAGPFLNPGVNYNFDERIEYSGYPQAGFATDGFLTYLSSQYQQNIVQNGSVSSRFDKSADLVQGLVGGTQGMNSSGESGQGLFGGGFNPLGMFSGAVSVARSLFNFGTTIGTEAEGHMRSDADISDVHKITTGAENSFMYPHARGAFAASSYHAGSGSGYLQYYLKKVGFYIEIATLRSDVLQQYTKYLNMFGYNSMRVGKPRVWTGSPHYATVDGKLSTYVRTTGMSVEASTLESSMFIENLFDKGVRFLKGSSLS
jgi:hypothetical protein